MLRYHSSRELSHLFQIPLNRWKRWSREFLPPDPLGGLQSGYARQFSTREAFIVYLGGFLVAGLGFSIPQARRIIKDLNGWLKKIVFDGYLFARREGNTDKPEGQLRHEIDIVGQLVTSRGMSGKLAYRIREIAPRLRGADGRWTETYTAVDLKKQTVSRMGGYPAVRCLLDITVLVEQFARLIKL
jgi:hypothetical protein